MFKSVKIENGTIRHKILLGRISVLFNRTLNDKKVDAELKAQTLDNYLAFWFVRCGCTKSTYLEVMPSPASGNTIMIKTVTHTSRCRMKKKQSGIKSASTVVNLSRNKSSY